MKKIGKISINPEKVIKNEELVNLKGGYGDGPYQVVCASGDYWGCGYDYSNCIDEGRECCDGPFQILSI